MREIMTIHITDGDEIVENVFIREVDAGEYFLVTSETTDGREPWVADYRTKSLDGAIANALSRGGFDVPNIATTYRKGDREKLAV